jgi:hypothetical protein
MRIHNKQSETDRSCPISASLEVQAAEVSRHSICTPPPCYREKAAAREHHAAHGNRSHSSPVYRPGC